jgi:predicted metal-binding protein
MQKPIQAVPTSWQDVILLCRKCSKKLKGGFGPDQQESLRRALAGELRRSGRRRSVRIIETKCLGQCPKGAVTVIAASAPATMLVVPAGSDPALLLARAAAQHP